MDMKYIELPRRVIVGDGAIREVRKIFDELGIDRNSLVISDLNTYKVAGKRIERNLDAESLIIKGFMNDNIDEGLQKIRECEIGFVIGVGGGSVIDTAKICAFKAGVPYASVPTAASHDGITSPQATIPNKKPVSMRVHSPVAIIADTEIIRKAPYRLLAAGCGDAISNYTAVLDWKLAKRERNEYFGDYAASLSMMSAKIVMENADKIRNDVSILVEALISSGVAMGIAGSSRPCSGAEHQFSHALDILCPGIALHGEQCGVGTIMMAYLHKADWKRIRDVLNDLKAPVTADDLGIEDKFIIKALTMAHKIRDRYTILRDGLSMNDAIKLAKKTGVIN